MRIALLAAMLFLTLGGCCHHYHNGVPVSLEPFHRLFSHAPRGVNTGAKPPCPYFDPPPGAAGACHCRGCRGY